MAEQQTKLGQCRDCAQGSLSPTGPGFSFYQAGEEEGDGFWYCCWCGSNHVDIRDGNGRIVWSGSDLYQTG